MAEILIDQNIWNMAMSILGSPVSADNPGVTWGMILAFVLFLWFAAVLAEKEGKKRW